MRLLRQLVRGLRALMHGAQADRDVDDEVRHYFDEARADHVQRGLSSEDAQRAARRDVGNTVAVREQVRASGWEHGVDTLLTDVRYALRRLRADAGFTAITMLTLAVGIGASTTIFSAVYPTLIQRLPYREAHQIVTVCNVSRDGGRAAIAFGTYRELHERSGTFEALAPHRMWQATLTGTGEPERLNGQRVGASYFAALGVRPAMGRTFDAAEDALNGPAVAVISHSLWTRLFAADSAIIGKRIALDQTGFTVIGVMPRRFENVLAPTADVWVPLQYDMSQGRAWGNHLQLVGRVRQRVRVHDAARELDAIARTPRTEHPRPPHASLSDGLIVSALQDDVTGGVRPMLIAVVGAAALLLLMSCVNTVNLLLARGAQRRGELATRAALGAPVSRLVRQLLTESVALGVAGGVLGLSFAAVGVGALVALSPPGMPRVDAIAINVPVLAFAMAVSAMAGLVAGIVPAVSVARGDAQAVLQGSSRRTVGTRQWTRRALVACEVSLAFVLIVGAGLLLRSVRNLFAITPGFDSSQVLTMQVHATGHPFDAAGLEQFYGAALDAVRGVPGVAAAALTTQLPLSSDNDAFGAALERDAPDAGASAEAFRYAVTPDYFEVMRIPLVRGRTLARSEVAGAPVSVIVSESFARANFPNSDALGQRLHLGRTDLPWYTIVGVVGDVKQLSLASPRAHAVYIAPSQWYVPDASRWLVVRTIVDPASLAAAIRNAVWSVDKDQPILHVATMTQRVEQTAADRRFALVAFEAFGCAALVLAVMGIYGLLAGAVAERRREMGVRAALGATRFDVVTLVVRQGMLLTAAGVAAGLAVAASVSGALSSLLFGVTRLDALTYIAGVGVLLVASLIACSLPALHASRVDPASALRAE